MAIERIIVPVEYKSASDSLTRLSAEFSKVMSSTTLSKDIKDQVSLAFQGLDEITKKYATTKPGEQIKFIDLKKISREGDDAVEYMSKSFKEIERTINSLALTPQIQTRMEAATIAIKDTKDNVVKLKDELKKIAIPDTMTTKGIGMGNISDIDKIFMGFDKKRSQSTAKIDDAIRSATAHKDKLVGKENTDEYRLVEENLVKLNELRAWGLKNYATYLKKKTDLAAAEAAQKAAKQEGIDSTKQYDDAVTALTAEIAGLTSAMPIANAEVEKSSLAFRNAAEAQRDYQKGTSDVQNSIDRMVSRFLSFRVILNTIRKVVREAMQVIRELSLSFTEIAMTTTYTTQQAWKMKDAFIDIAKTTGLTLGDVTKAAVEFFRQGRSMSEVMKLTEAAGLSAKIASISVTDSVKYLTSAINGYQLSASQAIIISDKFAELAATSATDYEELAIALSKVAAQAYSAGVEMDNMLGFISKALEVTREAPENIGTAFKTIFARMAQLKDFGATLEDGMSVNTVDKALKTIGVSLTDTTGQIRDLDDVLIETGYKWKDLTKNQKAYIATALAGTRQQTRLLAVFEDFDRTMELTKISANSMGASYAMQAKYYDSLNYAITRLNTAWQDFITNLVDSSAIVVVVQALEGLVNTLNVLPDQFKGLGSIILTLGAIMVGFALKTAIASASRTAGLLAEVAVLKARNKTELEGISISLMAANALLISAQATGADTTAILAEITALQLKELILQQGIGTQMLSNGVMAGDVLAKTAGSGANVLYSATTKAATAATKNFTVALLSNPLLWWIGAAVGGLWLLDQAFNAANRAETKYYDNMKKHTATIYNENKKINSVNTLVDKYKVLDSQINKTTESLGQMKDLAQQIQDIVGEDITVVINGKLNEAGLKVFLAKQKEAIIKEYSDIGKAANNRGGLVESYKGAEVKGEVTAMQQYLVLQATEFAKAENSAQNVYEFMTLTADEQSRYLAQAEAILKVQSLSDAVSESEAVRIEETDRAHIRSLMTEMRLRKGTTDAQKASLDMSLAMLDQSAGMGEGGSVTKGTLDLLFPKDKVAEVAGSLKLIGFETMTIQQQYKSLQDLGYFTILSPEGQEALKSIFPDIQAIEGIMTKVGDDTLLLTSNLVTTSKQFQNWKETMDGLDLGNQIDETQIYSDLLTQGPVVAFENLKDQLIASGAEYSKILDAQKALNDLINNMSIENLSQQAVTLNSVYDNLEKMNDMLAGNQSYDVAFMNQMLQDYGDAEAAQKVLTTSILTGQQLTLDNMKVIAEETKTNYLNDLEAQKLVLQNEASRITAEIAIYEAMSKDKVYLASAVKDATIALNEEGLKLQLNSYVDHLEDMAGADRAAAIARLQLMMKSSNTEEAALAEAQLGALNAMGQVSFNAFKEQTGATGAILSAFEQSIQNKILTLKGSLKNTNDQITAISGTINQINNLGTLKVLDSMKAKDAKEYAAQLNNIYILEQKLLMIRERIAQYQAIADNPQNGQEYVDAITSINDALALESATLKELVAEQKKSQNTIYGGLTPAMKGAVQIINGKMIPVMSKYNKLSSAQKEIVDDSVKEFNGLSESIAENTVKMKENEKAIADSIRALKEQIVDMQKTIADAVRNAEEEKFNILKASLEAEQKLLDKRKKMYEDAFAEQDYTNSLEETAAKREEIIKKLAALEGATDLNSQTKRQELLAEKATLDKEYNDQTVQYGRESLFKSIEDQGTALDAQMTKEEELYQKRIDDATWLQAQVTAIMNGGVDNIISYLKENSPEYSAAFDIERQLIEDDWRSIAEIAVASMDSIQDGFPDFSGLLADLAEVKAAVNSISGNGSTTPRVTTTTKKTSYEFNGKSYTTQKAADDARAAYIKPIRAEYERLLELARRGGGQYIGADLSRAHTALRVADAKIVKVISAKTGGEANYTGLAQVHGSKTKPERILSAVQTEIFNDFVSTLEERNARGSSLVSSEGITIGNITIQTPQLNTNQDWEKAGKTLFSALQDAVNERGLNTNKNKNQ